MAENQVATTLENLTMKDHDVIVTGSLCWYDISTCYNGIQHVLVLIGNSNCHIHHTHMYKGHRITIEH